MNNQALLTQLWQVGAFAGGGILLFYAIYYSIKKWGRSKKRARFPRLLEKYIHFPGLMLFLVIAGNIALGRFKDYIDPVAFVNIRHALRIMLIVSISFLAIRGVSLVKEMVLNFYARKQYKDYTLRSARTKYLLLQRVIHVIIVVITIAAVLGTFEEVRKVGNGLLASAGVAGLVIGFAAQKSLGSLIAGIQIALTQPIKLDDVVVINDVFGTIGEITLTYVVVNTWDEKRLIVPITFFIDNSFENWTRKSPEVIGEVRIRADYTLPIEKIRAEFHKWLDDSELWDKRKGALRISNADNTTIELRATMSAKNSDDAYDLEVYIREKLITTLQKKYPHALPSSRLKIDNPEVLDSTNSKT